MGVNNYFFVDGSSLIIDIASLKKSRGELASKKLDIAQFSNQFTGMRLIHLHEHAYKRFVVYFVTNENRIGDNILLPAFHKADATDDLQIKYCGKRVKGGTTVDKWISENNPPKKVLDRLSKSEKAVDTQICCDALQLASVGRLDRLFIYTNDYDFVPLCQSLKSLGVNISLFRLVEKNVNKDLVRECDSFSVVPETELGKVFV